MEIIIRSAILHLKIGDITKEKVDAIVNAANSSLMGGGGVDGAIHNAGGPQILEECKEIIKKISKLKTGEAVITSAGKMPSKYVIHTVGPIWRGGEKNEAKLLYNAYYNSLKLAKENGIKTISFPSISTGAYRFPLAKAAKIATRSIENFLQTKNCLKEINLVLFNSNAYAAYKQAVKV